MNNEVSSPKQKSQVNRELSESEKANNCLTAQIDELIIRLEPVVQPSTKEDITEKEPESMAPLAYTIRKSRFDIETQTSRIRDILKRLEI